MPPFSALPRDYPRERTENPRHLVLFKGPPGVNPNFMDRGDDEAEHINRHVSSDHLARSRTSRGAESNRHLTMCKRTPGAPPSPRLLRNINVGLNEGFAPPANFAMVGTGGFVYRSSFPKLENFSYLRKLKLKSIITLVSEPHPVENTEFMKHSGIKHFQIGMPGNKEPFVNIPDDKISTALQVILDRRNHPILIHCNKGKHRTGCVVGCLRKLQAWSLALIFDEYRRFADPKSRALDQLKIELYREEACMDLAKQWGWIPASVMATGCSMQECEEGCAGTMHESFNPLKAVRA